MRMKDNGGIFVRNVLKCSGYSLLALSLLLSGVSVQAKQTKASTSEEEHVSVDIMGENARTVLFNDGWKFKLGSEDAYARDFNDNNWRSLNLPHDWSIEQEFTVLGEAESGFLLGGTGWYRKSFVMPQKYEGKSIVIDFDGVYMNAEVYVNGKKIGSHPYGYTAFAFDLSDELVYDGQTENVIAVRVENKVPSSRWYSGSGIYRDVHLTVSDKLHVDRNGTFVTTPDLETEKNGDVKTNIKTTLRNDHAEEASVVVQNTVKDSTGKAVSDPVVSSLTIGANDVVDVEQTAIVNKPELWSNAQPTQYIVTTEILSGSDVVDTYTTTFGYRYFSFDRDNGFFLNGDALKLQGVCMHHDQGALGAVANETAVERQVQMLKDMGCNAIRVTHNPASKIMLEVCDRLGMLVIDEAFDGWALPKNGNTNDFSAHFNELITEDNAILDGEVGTTWAQYDAKAMVNNAKNSPSIIMWSIANEVAEGSGYDNNYPTYARNIIKWIQEEDMTRPVTIGDNNTKSGDSMYRQLSTIVAEAGGIVGLNYSNANSNQYQTLIDNNPSWTVYGSETSSAIRSRGIYTTKGQDNTNKQLSAYDNIAVGWGQTAQTSWKDVIKRDNVAGEFVWTGFDYIGEPTPWNGIGTGSVSGMGAAPKSSYFGIIDTAGFEKDVYYFYQSQWKKDTTTLHVLPCWNEDAIIKDGNGNVDVVVYSNAPTVELFLNGTSLGKKKMTEQTTAQGHTYYTDADGNLSLKWSVKYAKGTLSAKAYDADGNEITETSGRSSVVTSEAASKLNVTADRSEITADGKDLSYITVDVTDSKGNIVPNASNKIEFEISGNGKIVGVDNGNAMDTNSYKATSRNAFSGKALVIVQSDQNEGSFTVTAKSSGLASGSVTVTTKHDEAQDDVFMKSYKIAKHHYVNIGEQPELPARVDVTYSNGEVKAYDIDWNAYDASNLLTPGVFKVTGILEGSDVVVSVDVHVIGDIVAIQNYAAFTYANVTPELPKTLPGMLADGTLSEEFPVTWNLDELDLSKPGIYTVSGQAEVVNKTLPVTASIRVVGELQSADNIALNSYKDAPTLTQSCVNVSDNLNSINNGVTSDGNSTNERWTNWAELGKHETAYITMAWKNTYTIDKVDLYLFTDSYSAQLPTNVTFEYWNGSEYVNIPYSNTTPVSYTAGETTYLFGEAVETNKLRIGLLGQVGRCVGLTEAKVYNYVALENAQRDASLSAISIDGEALEGFDSNTFDYVLNWNKAYPEIQVESNSNASITILPVHANTAKIFVTSEDGKTTNVYHITFVKNEAGMKGILENAITKAEKAMKEAAFQTLAPSVKVAIQTNLDAALAVYNKADASNDEVLEAWINLANVMHYLDFQANKTMLNALVVECSKIDTGDYTSGVEEFVAALANANAVLADENALQARIDAAYSGLLAARDNLSATSVDKSVLKQMIDVVNAAKTQASNYVDDENWNNMLTVLADAQRIYDDVNATDAEVSAITLTLAAAYENIRLIPNEELLKQLKSFINDVEQLNSDSYSVEDYTFIMNVAGEARMLVERNDFTVAEFNETNAKIAKAYAIISDNVLEEPIKPETPGDTDVEEPVQPEEPTVTDKETDVETVVKPVTVTPVKGAATGDSTNMMMYAALLAGAGIVALGISRRKRK